MKILSKILFLLALPLAAFAQLSTTNTTLSTAVSANSSAQWCLASATGVVLPSLAGSTSGSYLFVDREAARVTGQGTSATCFTVKRGQLGTSANASHSYGRLVWVGQAATGSGDNSRPFTGALVGAAPTGSCTASLQYTLPVIVTGTWTPDSAGDAYYCTAGQWQKGNGQAVAPYHNFATFPPAPGSTLHSTSGVAGSIFFSQLYVGANSTATGACVLNGATVGTNKWMLILYDATGAVVANTATAGTTTSGASVYQCIAFTAANTVLGPGTYFLGAQMNGTTDNFLTYAANEAPTSYLTGSQTGTFGTVAPIGTLPTSFTANVGPVMTLY